MRWLFDNGYTTVSIGGCLGPLVDGRDTRRVAITFDDGYRNFYTAAVPVLTRYGFTATVFVVSDFATAAAYMGGDRRYMTWAEINAVQSLGIEIGSHSASHPKLWRLSRRQVEEELSRSKTAIEKAIGKPVRSFSHPFAFPEQYARFIKLMAELLEKHGYEVGVSTIIGTASVRQRRYFLPRIPINEHDDPALFRAKLIGAYDWMHVPQRLAKFCVRSAVANGN